MRNLKECNNDFNDYDYSPNELAELSIINPKLYKEIVESNIDEMDNIEDWQQRNLNFQNKLKTK